MTVPSLTLRPSGSDERSLRLPAGTGDPATPGFPRGSISKKAVNNVSEIRNGGTPVTDAMRCRQGTWGLDHTVRS